MFLQDFDAEFNQLNSIKSGNSIKAILFNWNPAGMRREHKGGEDTQFLQSTVFCLSYVPYVIQSMEREKICYDCDYRVAIAEKINKSKLFHIQMHRKNIIQKIESIRDIKFTLKEKHSKGEEKKNRNFFLGDITERT
jgi:hypothetical protein